MNDEDYLIVELFRTIFIFLKIIRIFCMHNEDRTKTDHLLFELILLRFFGRIEKTFNIKTSNSCAISDPIFVCDCLQNLSQKKLGTTKK